MNEKTNIEPLRVAVLDMNNNVPNQGMRCIRSLLADSDRAFMDCPVTFEEFDVRHKGEIPSLDFDVFLSTGGPGSPFDGEGSDWERRYFNWLDALWNHNERVPEAERKRLLSICHSFQIMCRHFDLGEVTRRRSESFGIIPVYKTEAGTRDPIFAGLKDPFWVADFREWQVIQPNRYSIKALGATILAKEKDRPHIELERAVMAFRVSKEILGLQFHPEADPEGMHLHFSKPGQREKIERSHGWKKYQEIIRRLRDPRSLGPTYDTIIPGFLKRAILARNPEPAPPVEA